MKIYFKRAKLFPAVSDSLPGEFIVESVKEADFSELHMSSPGWEELEQQEFDIEFAKNDAILQEFTDAKRAAELEIEQQRAKAAAIMFPAVKIED